VALFRVTGFAHISLDGTISFFCSGNCAEGVEAAVNDRSDPKIEAAIETAVRSLPTLWGNLEFNVESIEEVKP